jgi:hypothetical protein
MTCADCLSLFAPCDHLLYLGVISSPHLVAQHSTELTLFSLEETSVRTDAGHEIRGNIVVLVRL